MFSIDVPLNEQQYELISCSIHRLSKNNNFTQYESKSINRSHGDILKNNNSTEYTRGNWNKLPEITLYQLKITILK